MDTMNINRSLIIGEVLTPFEYSHTSFGEDFFFFEVGTKRESGYVDRVPCLISSRLFEVEDDLTGKEVRIEGDLRTRNIISGEDRKLVLRVFVKNMEIIDEYVELLHVNTVDMVGYICNPPIFRQTPKGRLISDFLLAVNYGSGRSAYIPCIAWGRNARFVERLETGTKIEVLGRFQSREYLKRYEDGTAETKTAYEISIQLIED